MIKTAKTGYYTKKVEHKENYPNLSNLSGETGSLAVHPGVGEYNREKDEIEYKAYYQWVPFVLFLQACLFYAPHALFKVFEGGKVSGIISGLHQKAAELHDEERSGAHGKLAKYFVKNINTHNIWAVKIMSCELLTFLNVLMNIFLIDLFLGGEFSSYGLDVINHVEDDPQNRIDPMSRVFPRHGQISRDATLLYIFLKK